MNKFEYRFYDSVYNDMIKGKKTIEFRLLTEKSEKIRPGDEIKFTVVDNKEKSITVDVLDKYFYNDINDLYNHKEDLSTISDYSKEELKEAFYKIFGKENVVNSKIVGIKFKVKGVA